MKIHKNALKNTNGITLVALVITIVVLLILVGISIAAIHNGVIEKAIDVKEKTVIAREKEAINIAWGTLKTDEIANGIEITAISFQEVLNNGGNNTVVSEIESEEKAFSIYFTDTFHTYHIDSDGNINIEETREYVINYVLNGGTNPEGQIKSFKGGQTIVLLNATKDNAYFQGWYESEDYTTDMITSISNRNENITLYAKFIDETPSDYFSWTIANDSATITGLSEKGLGEYNAKRLKAIIIPNEYNNCTVTGIGDSAFINKNLIEIILIPDSITQTLPKNSFNSITNLKELTIPITLCTAANVAYGGTHPFKGCQKITKVHFTKGENGIGFDYVNDSGSGKNDYHNTPWYYSRNQDIQVTFEEGITYIGNYMFAECNGLKSISIPQSVTNIGTNCFLNCKGLTEIASISVNRISDGCFEGCSKLSDISNVLNVITEVGKNSFRSCTGLNNLTIGNNITKLDDNCFASCTNIQRINILSDKVDLSKSCFNSITNLNELTIPITMCTAARVAYGGTHPFKGCQKITKVHFTKGENGIGFDYVNDSGSGKNDYHNTPWYYSRNQDIQVTFEEGITYIGNYMFAECTGLNSINYKDTVYNNSTSFKLAFEGNGGTISSSAFTNSGF